MGGIVARARAAIACSSALDRCVEGEAAVPGP